MYREGNTKGDWAQVQEAVAHSSFINKEQLFFVWLHWLSDHYNKSLGQEVKEFSQKPFISKGALKSSLSLKLPPTMISQNPTKEDSCLRPLDQGDSVGVWVDVWERDEGRELDTVDNNILLLTFLRRMGDRFFPPLAYWNVPCSW